MVMMWLVVIVLAAVAVIGVSLIVHILTER
jgi:hypothetical protein